MRPAFGTCIRLGMKSSVRSVVVFAFAFIAHLKTDMVVFLSVIGTAFVMGVPRPAVDAVYERVEITLSVVLVKHLFKAVIAY